MPNGLFTPSGYLPGKKVWDLDGLRIHTSDRLQYKRCRRKWDWASPIRQALVPKGEPPPALWFGTGFHFALEDYHGYNKYGHPSKGLEVYYNAHRQSEMPQEAENLLDLGKGMFEHYTTWIKNRNEYDTIWRQGEPLCEVTFAIPLFVREDGVPVYYVGTFDRCVVDDHGRSWIVDYKTAARIDTSKLEMDSQVSAYCWAADQILPQYAPFHGMLYMQFLKAVPSPPRKLQNGELSVAKNQNTSYLLYKRALVEGKYKKEQKYVDYLTYLSQQENWEGDKFIRRDLVTRNEFQKEAAWKQAIQEAREMTSPDIPLYPNPNQNCRWDCPFRAPCVALDDGSDWQFLIQENYAGKAESTNWKNRLGDSEPDSEEDVYARLLSGGLDDPNAEG